MTRRKLVVGNWKMHGSRTANAGLLAGILEARPYACDVAVCPPFPFLSEAAVALSSSGLRWGAQDCSEHEQGAYTGEVSARMLAEFGCRYVIVGHSERRALHGESDALVADKAKACLAHGVTPIVCVGETLAEREAGQTEAVVGRQLDAVIATLGADVAKVVVAYEPVWAIGTGKTPTVADVAEVHGHIRKVASGIGVNGAALTILYGGSVKGSNAGELMAVEGVDGALVGGASLDPEEFAKIVRYQEHVVA